MSEIKKLFSMSRMKSFRVSYQKAFFCKEAQVVHENQKEVSMLTSMRFLCQTNKVFYISRQEISVSVVLRCPNHKKPP